MRRSAAPSQLQKRGLFKPPFVSPPAKRPCVEQQACGTNVLAAPAACSGGSVSTKVSHVRSPADILSLIRKPAEILPNNMESKSAVDLVSNSDSEKQIVSPEHSQDEIHDVAVMNSPTPTSPLRETLVNELRPSVHDVQRVPPDATLHSAQMKIPSAGRHPMAWKRPQLNHGPRNSGQVGEENQEPVQVRYYSVVWCKRSKKKHKNWEGDAVLIVKNRTVIIKVTIGQSQDTEGKDIGRGSGYMLKDLSTLEEGSTLPVGSKEVEIQGVISPESYARGDCFCSQVQPVTDQPQLTSQSSRVKAKPFRLPTLSRAQVTTSSSQSVAGPLFDPTGPDTLVMPRPPRQHQWKHNSSGRSVIDVVVDPHISSKLRPHQHEGVIFLYECVMGFRLLENFGAILADEMGLGKTLQCITLIWTLLKQGPYGMCPIVKKVLIVTPSSLTNNWGKEFKKWLGRERVNYYIVDQNNKVEHFSQQQNCSIMIISYEMFVRSVDVIESLKFDLLLCDEGHRLKNANIKTTSLLASLNCRRRVILTGTPVQNDLQELFALVEFVNTGVLGTSASFRHIYENAIIASQQPNASQSEKELGENRASQLNRLTSLFVLRRTQDIINSYLPPKAEFVVFCQPSETQQSLYMGVLGCRSLRKCLHSCEVGDHLSAILTLRKLCNHPALLASTSNQETQNEMAREATSLLPAHIQPGRFDEEDSGKLAVVSCMLWALRDAGREKIVLVSNYTTTLDMLADLCVRYNYPYLRLDGSTPATKRQQLVDRFNDRYSTDFVFLLSAKAGGVGLNLIGASRILLYDIDWNPATDLQAMARVWRDGQKKKVYIYRLLMTGSLDEKMYQRQVRKQGLSGAVVDARNSDRVHFSTEELKDLFTVHPDTACLTHDLLECQCDQKGGISVDSCQEQTNKRPDRACQLNNKGNSSCNLNTTTMDQLQNWCHLAPPFSPDIIKDHCLEAASDFVTFVFSSESSVEVVKPSST